MHFSLKLRFLFSLLAVATLGNGAVYANAGKSTDKGSDTQSTKVLISVPEQKLVVFRNGQRQAEFRVSTSKFGVGARSKSYTTPLGDFVIASKVGAGRPVGAVFKGRRPTGEVLKPNAPGRDPIVTRILQLKGLDRGNANTYARGIYIHGTPQERLIGRPASYGCIRMKSKDVMRVFDVVPVGTHVAIVNERISQQKDVAQLSRGR